MFLSSVSKPRALIKVGVWWWGFLIFGSGFNGIGINVRRHPRTVDPTRPISRVFVVIFVYTR